MIGAFPLAKADGLHYRGALMSKRTDIRSILIIGAGPIIIGQACEFDYSGTQACKALKAEGYRIILVNSNPATIMTDPELADATYIEPITPEMVAKIIEAERPDAAAADHGRADRAQYRAGACQGRYARQIRRRTDRRQRRRHRQGRGPPAFPRGDDQDRLGNAAARAWRTTADEAAEALECHRAARDHPPVVHAWAAPAAASPTTARSFSRSSSAALMPRRRGRC